MQPVGSESTVSVLVTPARLRDLVGRLIEAGSLVVGGSIYLKRIENQKTKNGRFMHDYEGAAAPPTEAEAAKDEVPF